jgi:hypothetical protein
MSLSSNTQALAQRGEAPQPPDEKLLRRLAQAKNATALDTETSQLGVPDPVASNYDLEKRLPKVATALKKIVSQLARQILVARRFQIYRAGRSELYFLGKQKIFWNGMAEQWNGIGPKGISVPADHYETESFDFSTNFYKGYGESFMTTATQNVPGVPFRPEDPNRKDDIAAARGATAAAELIARWNDAPMLMSRLAYHGFTGGLMATYEREVTNGEAFGYEVGPDGEKTNVPKSRPVISTHGALDISVPMYADSQIDMDYLCWFIDVPRPRASATYPWLAGQIPAIVDIRDDDVLARLFRAAIRGNIMPVMPSDAMEDICTILRIWLRPSTFWYEQDDETRETLQQMFPNGTAVHYAGGKYAASTAESMDDHWAVESATEGRGMARPGIGEPFIEVQDQINILSNLFHEYLVYGIPPIFYHAKALDKEALRKMTAQVAQFLPVNMQDQLQSIGDLFWNPPPAQVPEALISRLDALAGPVGQFLTGIFPALMGGNTEGVANKTKGGYEMQLHQSMGRVAFFYRRLKSIYQRTMYNAVRDFAANRQKDLALLTREPGAKPQVISPVAIARGNFNVYPEVDEGYPALGSDKRALVEKLFELAKESPALQAEIDLPKNQAFIKSIYGLSDWQTNGEDARIKQLKEIDDMREAQPEPIADPNESDPTKAAVVGARSSVPIQPLDYDDLEYETCQEWANSETGINAATEEPTWYENVMLHAQEHKDRIDKKAQDAQQQAQQAPPPRTSITLNLKDMPPEAIAQELEKVGIHVEPEDFAVQHAMKKDEKVPKIVKTNGTQPTSQEEK